MRHPPMPSVPSWLPDPMPLPGRPGGIRVPRPAIIGLALLTLGLLTGLTRTPRGLLVIAAAGLLVATWDATRRGGRVLRVVALVALLALAAPAPAPTPGKPPAQAQQQDKAKGKGEGVLAGRFDGARDGLAELQAWVGSGFTKPAPWAPDEPKGGQ